MSATISVNGVEKAATATTIADLLRDEKVDLDARFLAVAINGAVVPRSRWEGAEIKPGDDIEIVRPAPGG
ncbi:MAG: sulfur carrier protein ThiS [Pseudomonadota bacterium]|nr:sulfur carrier protein ThiS [Pseudomonadota bacterium]